MFKRARQLKLSLAAKCQLLFGVAVVVIISAALLVPWWRMDTLMKEIDQRAARALAEHAKVDHVASHRARASAAGEVVSKIPPHAAPLAATQPATTQPAGNIAELPGPSAAPGEIFVRLLPRAVHDSKTLSRFPGRAFMYFSEKDYDRDYYEKRFTRDDGTPGYRYALALYAEQSCLSCHTGDPQLFPEAAALNAVSTLPAATTSPVLANAAPQLVGLVWVEMPSHSDTRQNLLNQVILLTAGLFVGSLAIIVFYLITNRLILKPVRVLQVTAEKVSEGDLDIRSDICTGDEFQQLSETFNTMLTNLKSSADQLRAINKSLDLKLGQLAESNVALYESNRLKSEFLANVSHELRTPLNSILGFAELLKDSLTTTIEPKTTRYITNILGSGQNLLDLINDLLDLAKIEAGRMEVRSAPLSMSDLFEGLGSILKPLTEAKHLTMVDSVDTDVPIIHTDPAKLQQVLYNFLSNAIKFSPEGGQITLAATRDDPEHIRVSVTDQGPGIEPGQQQVIFEKFRQIDGSVTRQHSGTGLGLAISKELMFLLGGSIGVLSAPGHGATFWVILPLKIEAQTTDIRGKLVLS